MNDQEDRIKNLEKEIQALKAELDLHWEADLKKQQEIQALQDKQHKEIIQKQEDGFFKQKMIWLGSFTGLAIAAISAFIVIVKKLKEAKKEIKELLKK